MSDWKDGYLAGLTIALQAAQLAQAMDGSPTTIINTIEQLITNTNNQKKED